MAENKMGQKPLKSRIIEIDFLRGVAIVLMATFHLVFDLMAYFNVPLNIYSGFWFWVGRLSAILFMIISGVTSSLGGRQIRRGLMVLGCALIVTLVSIPMMGENYIRFGILHFFGTVMILKGLYEKLVKNQKIRFGTALVLIPLSFWLGQVVQDVAVNTPLLLPLGIMYPGFTSFDYYPLLPWVGYFCIGIVLGMLVYKQKKSLLEHFHSPIGIKIKSALQILAKPLSFMGRHSLLVYLVHQPLILAVLYGLHWAGVL